MTHEGALQLEEIAVDALFLANSQEVQSGLAYCLGVGWTRCWPHAQAGQSYPYVRNIPITLIIRVPYHETNQEHQFRVSVRDSDENEIVEGAEGGFKVGRDTSLLQGMSQLVVVGMTARARLEKPQIYHVVVDIDGKEMKRIAFEALSEAPKH